MKRANENDDINTKNKKNKSDNTLIINQKKSLNTLDAELCNMSNIIINAFNDGYTKILFDLESDAFANHKLLSEKSLDDLMNQEKDRINSLINKFNKEEWLYFSVSNLLDTDRRNKIFNELKNDCWQFEHYVLSPCLDYMADSFWSVGWNDKPEELGAGYSTFKHTNSHRMKK